MPRTPGLPARLRCDLLTLFIRPWNAGRSRTLTPLPWTGTPHGGVACGGVRVNPCLSAAWKMQGMHAFTGPVDRCYAKHKV